MPTLYDENQQPVEVMDEAELQALQEKAEKAEALEKTLQEKEEALAKLSGKEMNFAKLREATEKEKEEMMKGYSVKEKMLIEEIGAMRARQDEVDSRYFDEAKESALTQLAGEDKELRTKLDEAVKESVAYLGKPKSSVEVTQRYERAYGLIMGQPRTVNPLNRFSPVTGSIQKEGGVRFTDTPQGKQMFESKFSKDLEKARARGYKG